ncbi:MAG: diaminopimelate epimerase [Cyanobacteria bacterium P01_H01_bin.74]
MATHQDTVHQTMHPSNPSASKSTSKSTTKQELVKQASGDITLPFEKMHGLGNDFVLLPQTTINEINLLAPENKPVLEKLARFLCDRHFGIGADGLILAGPPVNLPEADIRFIYLNSDGSWAEMCGNGIRCFARFAQRHNLVDKASFTAETLAGPISPTINTDGTVTVNMGAPVLEATQVPFESKLASPDGEKLPLAAQVFDLELSAGTPSLQKVRLMPVSMGNPHCIVFQTDQSDYHQSNHAGHQNNLLSPAVFGPLLEVHPAFPEKTNVEFVEIQSKSHLKVTVWERGCGFTLACGTGACATAVAAILQNRCDNAVDIELPGGILHIQWTPEPGSPVFMTGPAASVFAGNVHVPQSLFQAD